MKSYTLPSCIALGLALFNTCLVAQGAETKVSLPLNTSTDTAAASAFVLPSSLKHNILKIQFLDQGKLACFAGSNAISLVDTQTGKVLSTIAITDIGNGAFSLSEDGQYLATRLWNQQQQTDYNQLIHIPSKETVYTAIGGTLNLCPNGNYFVFISSLEDGLSGTYQIRSTKDASILDKGTAYDAKLSPNGRYLYKQLIGESEMVFTLSDWEAKKVISNQETNISEWMHTITPDSRYYFCEYDGILVDLTSGKITKDVTKFSRYSSGGVYQFTADGKYLIKGEEMQLIVSECSPTPDDLYNIEIPDCEYMHAIYSSANGRTFAIHRDAESLVIIDTASGTILGTLNAPLSDKAYALSPDGNSLITGDKSGKISKKNLPGR